MDTNLFFNNILHPPVMFFFLGLLASLAKSDLEIPPQIGKFLSLYLLFDIGIKGGQELYHSGFNETVLLVVLACVSISFLLPFLGYRILRIKLDPTNSAAIAATYGSISAVTFATAMSFLESQSQSFGGFMVAGMALMESPAIVSGLLLVGLSAASAHQGTGSKISLGKLCHESFFNGSVLLLVGSLAIGYMCGSAGEQELSPFVSDIFKGMLSLYMLDMGILAGARIGDLRKSGSFLVSFAVLYSLFGGAIGILCARMIKLPLGDSLLMTILGASASYIAVPAAMRMALPKANMSLLLPMSLGVTFSFNVIIGIPMYYAILRFIN